MVLWIISSLSLSEMLNFLERRLTGTMPKCFSHLFYIRLAQHILKISTMLLETSYLFSKYFFPEPREEKRLVTSTSSCVNTFCTARFSSSNHCFSTQGGSNRLACFHITADDRLHLRFLSFGRHR